MIGKVYLIANCTVKPANKQFTKLKHDYELSFKDNVMVQQCDEANTNVPVISYNFTAIQNLTSLAKGDSVDVLGNIMQIIIKNENTQINIRCL